MVPEAQVVLAFAALVFAGLAGYALLTKTLDSRESVHIEGRPPQCDCWDDEDEEDDDEDDDDDDDDDDPFDDDLDDDLDDPFDDDEDEDDDLDDDPFEGLVNEVADRAGEVIVAKGVQSFGYWQGRSHQHLVLRPGFKTIASYEEQKEWAMTAAVFAILAARAAEHERAAAETKDDLQNPPTDLPRKGRPT